MMAQVSSKSPPENFIGALAPVQKIIFDDPTIIDEAVLS
jgi:hypothetical protein